MQALLSDPVFSRAFFSSLMNAPWRRLEGEGEKRRMGPSNDLVSLLDSNPEMAAHMQALLSDPIFSRAFFSSLMNAPWRRLEGEEEQRRMGPNDDFVSLL